ncbi:MAG: hypothetical protein AB7N65_11415 [Vicinamibacterales bacterium]
MTQATVEDVRSSLSVVGSSDTMLILAERASIARPGWWVSFARLNEPRTMSLGVAGHDVLLADLRRVTALLPSTDPHYSISVITGACTSGNGGAASIVVDCVREPPVLSVALRGPGRDPWSRSWSIDHQIQHKVLALFDEAGG